MEQFDILRRVLGYFLRYSDSASSLHSAHAFIDTEHPTLRWLVSDAITVLVAEGVLGEVPTAARGDETDRPLSPSYQLTPKVLT
jgi:hypothetical protein